MGILLTFLLFLFFKKHPSWTWTLAWTIKISWKGILIVFENVINISFSSFLLESVSLDLFSVWIMKGKLEWGHFSFIKILLMFIFFLFFKEYQSKPRCWLRLYINLVELLLFCHWEHHLTFFPFFYLRNAWILTWVMKVN